MPDPWYDIEKAFFLDPKSGKVVARFAVFKYGVEFERVFDTYTDAEFWITKQLRSSATKRSHAKQ